MRRILAASLIALGGIMGGILGGMLASAPAQAQWIDIDTVPPMKGRGPAISTKAS